MAGKFQGPYPDPLITDEDMSQSFNGTPWQIETKDNIGLQFSWTGSNPIGAINVQVSTNYDPRFGTGIWTLLQDSTGTPIVISPTGSDDTGYFSLNQLEAQWVQVVYTTDSGSNGLLTAVYTAKAV